MKRFILPLLAVAFASVVFTSCDDTEAVVLTTYYNIKPSEWQPQYSDNGNGSGTLVYYYAPCGNSNLDAEAFQRGAVTAYLCTDEGDKPLPYTLYNQADTDGDGLFDAYWEDHFSYDIQNGGITFLLQASDFRPDLTMSRLGTLQFKVCVIRNF
ncbi:MAG: hypothetical protein SPJ13_01615 [Bacteroidales bacterium]|nr:hypothetical protein [Bacteroidales bacterium]